jgi:hypothetical protein
MGLKGERQLGLTIVDLGGSDVEDEWHSVGGPAEDMEIEEFLRNDSMPHELRSVIGTGLSLK